MAAPHPIALISVQLLVILAVARLLGRALRALGQPQVMGEVLGGILLGPSLLGWLAPGMSAALFPAATLPHLEVLSTYGIVFFMFLVGLELDPALLRGHGTSAILISQASIVVPFVLGWLAAGWLFASHAPPGVPFVSFALFMGAAMSVTAFPVLARILVERDLLGTRVGALAVTCAAVDDVTAWCLLAFVVAVTRAQSLGGAATTVLLALAYLVAMVVIGRPLLARLSRVAEDAGRLTQNLVAVVFLLVLGSAVATEAIGVHAVFGAFVLGAVLPKDALFNRGLVERIEDFAVVLLLPVYFAFTGLRTRVGLLDSPERWLECAVVIGLATLGKFGAATVAGRATGLPWRDASAIGVLVNTRGLMELVILNIGFDLGVLSPPLFAMMVLMAIVTTLATTPALALVYPPARFAPTADASRSVRAAEKPAATTRPSAPW